MSCPPHPHTLPASSPPLARPSFRVLIDRVSFVRPASSSILSLNHPATTTLHTRTPPFACTLRPPSPVCIFYPTHFGSAILPSPPPPHPVGVRLLPPKPEPAPRHLSSSVTSSPCPHLSRARPRCYAPPCSLSLSLSPSLALSLSLPPRLGGVRGWGRRASIPSALCCAWFVWLGKAGRYPPSAQAHSLHSLGSSSHHSPSTQLTLLSLPPLFLREPTGSRQAPTLVPIRSPAA